MSAQPSKLPEPGAPDVLYLVDLSGYLFRAYHALPPLTSPSGEPTGATFGTVAMLVKLLEQRRPAWIAVAMDSPGKGIRGTIDPGYKANRPPAPPDLPPQIRRCREIVEAWGMPVFARDDLEADDIIATLARHARAAGLRVVIASSDKDLLQLVEAERVLEWDAMRDRVFGPVEVREKLGVGPELVADYLALVGDSSDNVRGVPGVGPKTAAKLLGDSGSLDALLANLEAVERPKLRDAIAANREPLALARELVRLRDVADLRLEDVTRGARRWTPPPESRARLRSLFVELGFSRLVAALDAGGVLPLPDGEPAASGTAVVEAASAGDARPAVATSVPIARPSAAHETTARDGAAADPPAREPTATGPEPPRSSEVRVVRTADALARLCAEATRGRALSVIAFGSDPEPMRAAIVGLALATSLEVAPAYLPLGHRRLDAGPQLDLATVRELLGPLLADPAIEKRGHDVKLSAVLLERHGLPLRGVRFDSLIASYLLDPESPHDLARLAERDANLGWPALPVSTAARSRRAEPIEEVAIDQAAAHAAPQAMAVLRLTERYRRALDHEGLAKLQDELELPLLELLVQMELTGVMLDAAPLGPLSERMAEELAQLEARAHAAAGHEFNVASPKQLETILFDELGLRAGRKTKTGRSTDAEALEAIAEDHPLPKLVLEHRAIAKLKGTYVDTLPKLVHPETKRLHTRWDQAVAATGRLASNNPNLQNIPVRTAHGKQLRRAFVAPEGKLVLSADYSQIELRVLAHLSHDPVLLDAFRSGEDIHARTAMEIFGVPADGVTDEMRRQSKTINFGIIYGMGPVALAKRLGIARADAARFIDAYLERYRGVRAFMDETLAIARETRQVRTLLGRLRRLPDIDSGNHQRRAYAERIAQNTPIQGTAADLLKLAMVRLREPPVAGARMVLTVHDELVFEVPADAVEPAAARVRQLMESVYPLDVPLVVDVGWGVSWADAH